MNSLVYLVFYYLLHSSVCVCVCDKWRVVFSAIVSTVGHAFTKQQRNGEFKLHKSTILMSFIIKSPIKLYCWSDEVCRPQVVDRPFRVTSYFNQLLCSTMLQQNPFLDAVSCTKQLNWQRTPQSFINLCLYGLQNSCRLPKQRSEHRMSSSACICIIVNHSFSSLSFRSVASSKAGSPQGAI
jgi:hypothetical protein